MTTDATPNATLAETIEQQRRWWKGKPLELRLNALNAIFIKHDAVLRILKHIERELVLNAARGKATGTLIIAPPGGGKSTLIKHLHAIYPSVVTETLTTRPVIAFEIPKAPTASAMGTELLKATGGSEYLSGNAQQKFCRAVELFQKVEARILAVDNFHDVPEKRGVRGVKEIGNWVRDLCEAPFPGVVLAFGTEEAAVVRDSNPQLLRRMQARLELPLFSLETPAKIAALKKLMKQIDNELPLAESSQLDSGPMLGRIVRATNGNLDYIMKLLASALVRAVARGSERIELQDLRLGFEDQHQVAAEYGNPFDECYKGAPLVEPGQIFHRVSVSDDKAKGGGNTAGAKPRTGV